VTAISWFAEEQRPGLLDFWHVYDRHYTEIIADTLRAARAHPEFAPIIAAMTSAQLETQNRDGRERLRRAIDGAWDAYEAELRIQGSTYASLGISFAGWYDLVGAFKQDMVPLLLREYEGNADRQAKALRAMQSFIDRTMRIIGEQYLSTKEAKINEQRARAEDNEQRYRMLFDNSPAPMWVYDRETLAFLAVNRAAVEHYGYSEAEFLGMTIEDIRFAEDLPRLRAENARLKSDQTVSDIGEWRHRKKDGTAILVELRVQRFTFGKRQAHMIVATDVTERKRAELPGRFFTLSLDLLCIAGLDGYFKRLNPAFSILGYTEEELLSRPFLDFVHDDDRAATIAEVQRLAAGAQTVDFENRYRCRDGSYRTLIWSAASDPSGLIYAAAHDITLLTERNAELMRVSRAKTDFLAMMSHELRTPLNSIIGFSEVLIDEKFGALNDKQSRYLRNVHQSGRHLLGLINDLLDLSKVEAGRLEIMLQPCAPRTLAADAIVTLQPLAAARGVRVTLGAPEQASGFAVMADGMRLKQVLYNLLSNAIKFTRPEGEVRIVCARSPQPDFVRLSVVDEGAGVSEADLAKLFTPFKQLSNAAELGGTGLGLALTKQLVEAMGGTIGVESEVGRGSTFFVDLPRSIQTAEPRISDVGAAGDAPLALVVDDEPAARELLVLALQGSGFRTLTASSGDEAIAQARRQLPDVITLDVFLPTIDGWDVLRLLKSNPLTANIPVVMVSISSERARAFSLGAIEHLVKPVAREELLEALARRSFTTRTKTAPIHVLAIDDDVHQLDLFRAALEPQGFRVRTESSGRSGIEAAATGPVDLVLLDLVMPDVSGVEVVATLRANPKTRAVPILLVTAHDLSAADRARLNGDVDAIVSKGAMSMDELLGEISRVLRKTGGSG
jgi:PAS domain S-box-containing protein